MKPICKLLRSTLLVLILSVIGCSTFESSQLDKIKLPDGFSIQVYAEIPHARSLTLGPDDLVFVGTRKDDKVYAVRDNNNDGAADDVWILASNLDKPNGVAFYQDDLYIAQSTQIIKLPNIATQLTTPPSPEVVFDQLPDYARHEWKFIAFGPDERLYIPVGAPCNVGESNDAGAIYSIKPDGTDYKIHAQGVRNSVGFDWHPQTHALWFTDNGRDLMGDDIPADELNHAPNAHMHFGFPYCHAGDVPDSSYDEFECSDFTPPAIKLGPHVAALGMRFYTGQQFPNRYHNQIFIAEHGSWNRSTPIGYRISLVTLEGNNAISYETFAEGWLQGEHAWGRPVDVLVMPDGALLISDDKQGLIYRISYRSSAPANDSARVDN